MAAYYCPSCWREVAPSAAVCPGCGADIPATLGRRTYEDKLIAALAHPEPETPVRAAWLLGRLRSRAAVAPLLSLVRHPPDAHAAAAAVEALGRIGDPAARPLLEELAGNGPLLLRRAAETALREMPPPAAATPDPETDTRHARAAR